MKDKAYIFGGESKPFSSEILRHDSDMWHIGPSIPINKTGTGHCGVSISDNKLLLIPGNDGYNVNNIVELTTSTNIWRNTSVGISCQWSHSCLHFNGKVFVTGGRGYRDILDKTEIIEMDNGNLTIRNGGSLKRKRYDHGMGIITLDGIPTLIAFGGRSHFILGNLWLDSVEIWNSTSETWQESDLKMERPRAYQ